MYLLLTDFLRVLLALLYSFDIAIVLKNPRTAIRKQNVLAAVLIPVTTFLFKNLLFDCHTANSGPLSSGQSLSLNVSYCVLSIFDPKVTGILETRLAP